MDLSVSPTRGEQEMSVWSGHYECTCYHPLFVFNLFGDLERCALPGNVHGADALESVLKPGRGALSRQAVANLFSRRRQARPRRIYKPRRDLNDFSVLSKSCYGPK